MRRAVVDFEKQGAKALVLDLRNNPGGPLSEAVEVTNLFVPRGQKVVYTKGKLASVNSEYYTKKRAAGRGHPVGGAGGRRHGLVGRNRAAARQ